MDREFLHLLAALVGRADRNIFPIEPTLKSTPMVAVDDSESNWSSQYRMSTISSVRQLGTRATWTLTR